MALAALIIIEEEEAFAPEGQAAQLFGQSVTEFQCRIAHRLGAGHFVILAQRMPLALMTAVDRLRRDGIVAEIVRTPHDAADHIHPDEQVLLFCGAIVPHPDEVQALSRHARPALLTVPGGPGTESAFRIDAQSNWAGLAALPGTLVRETSAMLGDWDFASTLLRRAVQQEALLVPASDEAALRPVQDGAHALIRSRTLLGQRTAPANEGLVSSWIARAGGWLAPHVLRAPALIPFADPAPIMTASLGVLTVLAGWSATGLALLLFAHLLEAIARPLTSLPIGRFRGLGLFSRARRWAAAAGIVASGFYASWASGDYAALVAALWLASLLRPLPQIRVWSADGASAMLFTLAGLATGQPLIGLALGILHALASRLDAERSRQP